MTKNRKIAILPRLYDHGGDVSKQWFIIFSIRNPVSGEMGRFRVSKGLNHIKDPVKRRKAGNALKNEFSIKIRTGWNPFTDADVIYEDHLAPGGPATEFKKARAKNKTWSFILSEYLRNIKSTVRDGTFQSYQSKFRIFNRWLEKNDLQGNDIVSTSPEIIRRFVDYLISDRNLCGEGINEYRRLFRTVCRTLITEKKLLKDPWDEIKQRKHITQTPSIITDQQLQLLKEETEKRDPQLWLVCQFIFYCFIRPRELRFLKIKNIDFDNGRITVPGAISKNKKTESVILPDHFRDILKSKEYQNENSDYYLFSVNGHPGSTPVGKNYFWNHFDKIRTKLRLSKDCKFYSFKHTGGVKLKQSGADVIEMKNQFRHYSLDETWKYINSLAGAESDKIRFGGPRI